MLIACLQCHKKMNLKRKNFPGQRFKEEIKLGKKTTSTVGYFCKTCSKGK